MSREQLVQVETSTDPDFIQRYPRKWFVVWTYGRSDQKVVDSIEDLIMPHYSELIEVFSPTITITQSSKTECEPATKGYIYLKAADPDFHFFDAVRNLPGVGGFLREELNPSDVKRMLDLRDKKVSRGKNIQIGDLVEVVIGPLRDSRGRVVNLSLPNVIIELNFLGRLVSMPFKESELEVAQ